MLEARNISFTYPKAEHPLYQDFSLAISPGERVALQAPSGFGKTTLCRILAGFERPQSGEILVDGQPLPQAGPCPVQLISQHPELAVDPRMRMRDTLAEAHLPRPANPAGPVGPAPDPVGLAPDSATPPDPDDLMAALGIQPAWLTRFPHELSGGELQRFCIARALMVAPRYLIADEISTMLDAVTQAQIWRFLLEHAEQQNIGLVFVSHSPALTARIATRTIALQAE